MRGRWGVGVGRLEVVGVETAQRVEDEDSGLNFHQRQLLKIIERNVTLLCN